MTAFHVNLIKIVICNYVAITLLCFISMFALILVQKDYFVEILSRITGRLKKNLGKEKIDILSISLL